MYKVHNEIKGPYRDQRRGVAYPVRIWRSTILREMGVFPLRVTDERKVRHVTFHKLNRRQSEMRLVKAAAVDPPARGV